MVMADGEWGVVFIQGEPSAMGASKADAVRRTRAAASKAATGECRRLGLGWRVVWRSKCGAGRVDLGQTPRRGHTARLAAHWIQAAPVGAARRGRGCLYLATQAGGIQEVVAVGLGKEGKENADACSFCWVLCPRARTGAAAALQ